MQNTLTTGQAAKLCQVSQQTIIKCFDSGQLKGFRVPGSKYRRIPRGALVTFMQENGIPVPNVLLVKGQTNETEGNVRPVSRCVDAS